VYVVLISVPLPGVLTSDSSDKKENTSKEKQAQECFLEVYALISTVMTRNGAKNLPHSLKGRPIPMENYKYLQSINIYKYLRQQSETRSSREVVGNPET
jgi:hypothetical protein